MLKYTLIAFIIKMKNLKHLDIEYFNWYKDIVNSKNENNFLTLDSTLETVNNANQYLKN